MRFKIIDFKILFNIFNNAINLYNDDFVSQRKDYLYVMLITNLLMLQYYKSKIFEYYNIQQNQMFLNINIIYNKRCDFFSIDTTTTIAITTRLTTTY